MQSFSPLTTRNYSREIDSVLIARYVGNYRYCHVLCSCNTLGKIRLKRIKEIKSKYKEHFSNIFLSSPLLLETFENNDREHQERIQTLKVNCQQN
jgi:hypothetical protein